MKTTRVETACGIALDLEHVGGLEIDALERAARAARETLEAGTGPGAGFRGWLDLPARTDEAAIRRLEQAAAVIRRSDALVVVGIGGSYLGARAVIDALSPPFEPTFPVLFAGHHLDAGYHAGLLAHLRGKRYAVNVISKSGTTTEPGVAFRFLLGDLSARFSKEELRDLVFATTDRDKGTLRRLCDRAGYTSFEVPDDVGGRFSVLTPVGLLPLAAAGVDIRAVLSGAHAMMERLRDPGADGVATNAALAYAAYRNAAYRRGAKIEVLASYIPRLATLSEWWKQLFGESEGKSRKGIFPASVNLTTDLHSLGQWLQDGERIVCETVVDVLRAVDLTIPASSGADDGFEQLTDRPLHDVNRTVLRAALLAHADGGVPCARLEVPKIDAATVGALIYFFEYACGVSAYLLGVNPFDQPGVEAYKKKLHELL